MADRTVAVIVHKKKALGKGPAQVREELERAGFPDPLWYEVPKSKKAPKRARKAAEAGADLVFVWGGDGTVQRCVDALAGHDDLALAIIPAGTSNLLATSLDIPKDPREAVRIGLEGGRRTLDTGTVNGEHFVVMAGAGFDALMMRDADSGLKDKAGRAAYFYTGAKNLGLDAVDATVDVDGDRLYKGATTCVLVGNTSEIVGGIDVFEGSEPDDGVLEVGVVTAEGRFEWLRTLVRTAVGRADESKFVKTARGKRVTVTFSEPLAYQLDGGDRDPERRLVIEVEPASITVCVPSGDGA